MVSRPQMADGHLRSLGTSFSSPSDPGFMYAVVGVLTGYEQASRLCLNTRGSLHRHKHQFETAWLDDIELHDRSGSSAPSNIFTSTAESVPDTIGFSRSAEKARNGECLCRRAPRLT